MSPIETPAFRLTSDCIWNSFRSSNKRHLVLTGARKSGKSTLLSGLFPESFRGFGVAALQRCRETDSEWIAIDEIGYLESGFPDYCSAIRELMNEKRLIAVVRKQNLPFWDEIYHREDVFLVDLDDPFGSFGCVIMASGLGKRFGGNKLIADFKGKPLIQWILNATEGIFSSRIVVTRHREVEELCRRQGIKVLYHEQPYRSDTIRLGLQALTRNVEGCLFCPGDQPLLKPDTIAALALSAVHDKDRIWRTVHRDTAGAPVLFPAWTFPELLTLPKGKGGSFLLKKYPEQIRTVPVRDKYELMDIDCPEDLKFLEEICKNFPVTF